MSEEKKKKKKGKAPFIPEPSYRRVHDDDPRDIDEVWDAWEAVQPSIQTVSVHVPKSKARASPSTPTLAAEPSTPAPSPSKRPRTGGPPPPQSRRITISATSFPPRAAHAVYGELLLERKGVVEVGSSVYFIAGFEKQQLTVRSSWQPERGRDIPRLLLSSQWSDDLLVELLDSGHVACSCSAANARAALLRRGGKVLCF